MLKVFVLFLLISNGISAREVRVYQTDTVGNIQYHLPSYVITEKGQVILVDLVGNKQYHKQQFKIETKTKGVTK